MVYLNQFILTQGAAQGEHITGGGHGGSSHSHAFL